MLIIVVPGDGDFAVPRNVFFSLTGCHSSSFLLGSRWNACSTAGLQILDLLLIIT